MATLLGAEHALDPGDHLADGVGGEGTRLGHGQALAQVGGDLGQEGGERGVVLLRQGRDLFQALQDRIALGQRPHAVRRDHDARDGRKRLSWTFDPDAHGAQTSTRPFGLKGDRRIDLGPAIGLQSLDAAGSARRSPPMKSRTKLCLLALAVCLSAGAASTAQARFDSCRFNFGMSWNGDIAYPAEVDYLTIWAGSDEAFNDFWIGAMLRACKAGGR